ncbi:MAG: hypothetical protein R3E58_13720 [Phycisphaerae bacterium]
MKGSRLTRSWCGVCRALLTNSSMRDALSLLDQLLAYGASNLTAETIEDVLPGGHDETLAALVDAIAQHDAAKALECVDRSLISGYARAILRIVYRICPHADDPVDLRW